MMSKITRPRLHSMLARERLFARLTGEGARAHHWIAGLPGCGKTVLAATYAEASHRPAVWYQLDPGDADLSTFFFYFRQALAAIERRRRSPPPLFTSEFASDAVGFARRYFGALSARLPEDSLIVLDNYHELPADTDLHAILALAMECLPAGVSVIVTSRASPPPAFARAQASEWLATLDWQTLRFSLEETAAIAATRGLTDLSVVTGLHERSGGWAAGITLFLEEPRARFQEAIGPEGQAPEALFNYFADQVLRDSSPAVRDTLMRTAFLPRVTVHAATALTGHAGASRVLEDFYRRQLFTDRRGQQTAVYQYHDLFREFLQAQARRTYTPEALRGLYGQCATVLIEEGESEHAIPLYCAAGLWDVAAAQLVKAAPRLIAEGRWRQILLWIDALPPTIVEQDPWLLYWRGMAPLGSEPARGRESLQSAWRLADAKMDLDCRMEAAAAIVESYFLEYSDFTPLDAWIPVIAQALSSQSSHLPAAVELRIQGAFLNALTVRPIALEQLDETVARVFDLIPRVEDVALKASASRTLVILSAHTGRLEIGARAARLLMPLLDHAEVYPFSRAMCYFALSWFHVQGRTFDAAAELIARTQRMAAEEGMPQLARLAHYMAGYVHLSQGRIQEANRQADLMEQTMFADHLFDVAALSLLRSWVCIAGRNPQAALRHAREAVNTYDRLGSRMHHFSSRGALVIAIALVGDEGAAREAMRDYVDVAAAMGFGAAADCCNHATLAYLALRRQDRDAAVRSLSLAFASRHTQGGEAWLKWSLLAYGPHLHELALERELDMAFARQIVRELSWQTPAELTENWPWAVKIRTLGGFEVLVDDAPLQYGRKTPRRVLALLKALIALGGRDVPESKLTDALWPDEDGDNAHKSFEVTVRRLRVLLGVEEAIEVTGGVVSLNTRICWVDTWDLDHLCSGFSGSDEVLAARLVRVYRGSFLPADAGETWTSLPRERHRARFLRTLAGCGLRLREVGHHQAAIELYERGSDVDPLAEEIYLGMMRSYLALGKHAEVLRVHGQLMRMLKVELGVTPSPESEAVARTARERGSPQ